MFYSLAVPKVIKVGAESPIQAELLLGDAAVGGGAKEIVLKAPAVARRRYWGAKTRLAVFREAPVCSAVCLVVMI